ncbi:MAG: ribosome maturation factor RimM [Pseudomonadota bacterium]
MNEAPNKSVIVGRIGAPHGVRGEVRVQPFTADPMALAAYTPLTVAVSAPNLPKALTVKSARPAKTVLVMRFAEVTTREMAEALNGAELAVPRDRLDDNDLDDDEFFITDLVGLEARLADGVVVGKVSSVDDHGAGDVLTIQRHEGGYLLLAFTMANVPHIAIAEGQITICLPEEVDAAGDGAPNTAKTAQSPK